MEEVLAKLLDVRKHIEENPFKGTMRFPLGTKRPHTYYIGRKIPEKDVVHFDIPVNSPTDATSFICVGKAGTFKTTLLKRILYYYYHLGFNCGVLDLKGGMDWVRAKTHKWSHGNLHPLEKPDRMKIVAGSAQFALNNFDQKMQRRFVPLNLRMKNFAEKSLLIGLGFSPGAVEVLLPLLQKCKSIEEIRQKVEQGHRQGRYHGSSVQNILLRLINIERDDFWVNKDPFVMNKYWNAGKVWALGFFGAEKAYVSPYVAKIMKSVFTRSINNSNEKYFFLVDDAQNAFGADMPSQIYESVSLGIKALTQWRFRGINIAIAAQSPTLLNREIYNEIKNYFIFRCGSIDALRDYIVNPDIFDVAKNLYFDQKQKISECIWVKEDGYTFENFFPFGAIIGH